MASGDKTADKQDKDAKGEGAKLTSVAASGAAANAQGSAKASSAAAPPAAASAPAPVSATPALPPRDPARDKAIELAVSTIEKQFGKGSIMRLGEDMAPPEVQVIPTGSLGLDIALGTGGLPRGRIVEIYGPESSGKTTLALHVVGEAQRMGGICAFVDAEHALDVSYARKLGVRTDDLLVSQPDCGEQALEITEMLVRSGAVDIIVVDSVAALTPKAELEGEMGDSHVGLQARLMSQALRKLTGTISKSNTLVIFINQIRMKIGVMFGNPETTTGGNALKFYASCRLDIRRIGALKDGDKVVGNRTRVKVVKNKMAPPFREVEFDILYGEGISHEGDLVDLGSECGAVEKSGAWFSVEGERIGQGRDNAKQFLVDHPELARKVEAKVLAHHGIKRDVDHPPMTGQGGTLHALPRPTSEKRR
jgi:recombination protein RecA